MQMKFSANKIVAQTAEKKPEKESSKSKPIAKPPKRHSNFFLTINTQKNKFYGSTAIIHFTQNVSTTQKKTFL